MNQKLKFDTFHDTLHDIVLQQVISAFNDISFDLLPILDKDHCGHDIHHLFSISERDSLISIQASSLADLGNIGLGVVFV